MGFQDGRGVFGDIKSKLGFGARNRDAAYEDEYDDYGEPGDYDEFAEYADEPSGYSTRPSRSSYDNRSFSSHDAYEGGSARGAGTSASSMPRLVSLDDVRANTRATSGYGYDSPSSRRGGSSAFGRTMVDSSLPPQMTPEGAAAVSAAASRRRSEGLDSLFEPSLPTPGGASDHAPAHFDSRPAGIQGAGQRTHFESDMAPSLPHAAVPSRRVLSVVRPVAYGDAERVADALRRDEVVVLVLEDVPAPLTARLLDFSFGVACALGASVECVADKVFALAVGAALTDAERLSLRSQGVLR